MTTRRKAIENIFKSGAALSFGGLFWGLEADDAANADYVLRPPGALEEKEFVKACIKCGQCVEACPYDSLSLSTPGKDKVNGTPYLSPREIPCYMCIDIPCTNNCPSGALDINSLLDENNKPNIDKTEIGIAVIHKESCLAYWGIQCDACYRACPLIDKAIKLEKEINKVTNRHANIVPIVDSEYCTGCGKCEHVCVTEKAAVFVLPRKIATGKVGDHYIKSWQKSDEKRIKPDGQKVKQEDDKSAIEYLNDDKELYD